jgi:paraquat-inducible protein B
MADEPDLKSLPKAAVTRPKRTRVSAVWIIPILAALVALGIAIQRVVSEGPTITIIFKAAEGIEAGKTFIKYKDVRIGQVTAVQLTDDYTKVQVKAKIAKHAAGLMLADAKFWVVEPRITLSGVSGLNTLLSGNYIGFQTGTGAEYSRTFVGLDDPPPITDRNGRRFVLKAENLGSLGVGSPVYYRRINVGQVASYSLAPDGRSVEITVFVDSPHDQRVTPETRFWNASGIDVSVGADGVDVRTESLAALIAGGLAFATPDFLPAAGPAAESAVFTLYANRTLAMKQPDPVERRYVLHFNESVRGLSVGAPVVLYGMRVGEVTDVGLAFDQKTLVFRPRVLITFFPDRVVGLLSSMEKITTGKEIMQLDAATRLRILRRVVEEKGLRAQLRTGSLLTGELYIAFEYFPNASKPKLDWTRDPLELPVVAGGLTDLEAKLTSILAKIDALPLDAIGADVRTSLATLNQTLKDADVLINRVDAQWVPEGTKTLQELRGAIATADRALISVDRGLTNADATFFGKDSPAPQDLRDTLQEVTRAARAVRILVDYLERHPEMLIRGKPEGKP